MNNKFPLVRAEPAAAGWFFNIYPPEFTLSSAEGADLSNLFY